MPKSKTLNQIQDLFGMTRNVILNSFQNPIWHLTLIWHLDFEICH